MEKEKVIEQPTHTPTKKKEIEQKHEKEHAHNITAQKTAEVKTTSLNDSEHHSKSHVQGDMMGKDHHKIMLKDFQKRFWMSLILSIPVLILSPMLQSFFNIEFTFTGNLYVLFALSSVVYFYGGFPFLKGLKDEAQKASPGMMTLIGVAITIAYLYSSAVAFGLAGKLFFWELVTLIDIMLLGHWIEMKSVLGASKALELLVSMLPFEAHKIQGDKIIEVKLDELNKDDIILIKPGEKIPADGEIIEGESYLNEAMLTGESKPVKKGTDQQVIGGSINGNGSLKVKVVHTGKYSYLNKVITLVQEAQKYKSQTQNFADSAAKWLTYIALGVGFGTLLIWISLGFEFVFALERMVSVMVISCPHALGLAIPLVAAISTSVSAKNGLLIRNRTAFENSRKITTIVFDKTGTLTKGDFKVTRFESTSNEHNNEKILAIAAALEQQSEHPIGLGIVHKTKALNLNLPKIKNFNALTGVGIEANVNDLKVKIVSPGYLHEKGITIPENAKSNGMETTVYVMINDKLSGFIALADEIRPESYEAVKQFKKNNINVKMATGDNEEVAKAVSRELGLDGYYSQVLPHEKVNIIKELQKQGEFVAMTGDGVNDAPALAQANVGIAVGSGTDIAAETADIILTESNPEDIINLILFGKATYRKMIQNLVWATGYNVVAIPLAAGVLYSYGFILSPAIGAVIMSISTVIVAINAQLLKSQINKMS